MVKKIENKEDFMAWANEVNTGNFKYLCNHQDTFAHSEEKQLKKLFVDAEKYEKELMAFSISKAIGQEKLFSFMKSWALKQANICIEENEKNLNVEFEKLNNERNAFESHKDGYERRAKEANEIIDKLTNQINHLIKSRDDLYVTIGNKDNEIEELKRENNHLGEYVSKANDFRLYMKRIIQENNIQL